MASKEPDVQFVSLQDDIQEQLKAAMPNSQPPLKTVNESFVMPAAFQQFKESIYNFPLDRKDVWVVTYPRSGTTWTQEQVWLLANNADFEGSKTSLHERFPFLETLGLLTEEMLEKFSAFENSVPLLSPEDIARLPSPRFIKTHLPFFLLPQDLIDTCKVIYVARNPKDVCISRYYNHKLIKHLDNEMSFEAFADLFLKDLLTYSPYWDHVKTAWKMRSHPNFLFLFYEDMKADLTGEMKKTAKFLGKDYSEEDYERLKSHLAIENFKNNASVNNETSKKSGLLNQKGNFIRKGKTGGWKDHFSPKLNETFDAWIQQNSQDTDLRFKYELDSQD